MSHHKVCAHLKEICLGECTQGRGVYPNIPCSSTSLEPMVPLPPRAKIHDVSDAVVTFERKEINLFFKLKTSAKR